jgi:hypothetical protein
MSKCYDSICNRDNLSCLLDCNSMLTNILRLKEIHDKLNKYENLLEPDRDNIVYQLKQKFQQNLMRLCDDFNTEYDKIITDTTEK